MEFTIRPDGTIEAIYSDDLAPIMELGTTTITRVSNVEPTVDGRWTAAIIDGPILGPFRLRSEALQAEVEWLQQNRGL